MLDLLLLEKCKAGLYVKRTLAQGVDRKLPIPFYIVEQLLKMPTAIRSQHFVLERLLKKVVREGWPETFGRAHAPIDTGSEQINRLSQGRLRTAPSTRDCSWPPEDREARVLQQSPLPCAFLSRSSASP